MLNLLLKLPGWLLLLLSGKKQKVLGERKLNPAFQFIASASERLNIDVGSLTPEDFRQSYEAQNDIDKKLSQKIITKDHYLKTDGPEILLREYTNSNVPEGCPALLYFHGGGWVIGNVETHNKVCADLCEQLNMKIFSLDYRLSPEYKFPAPLDDCLNAYEWLLNNASKLSINKENLSVGGDSAGGNLSAAVSLVRKKEGASLPKAQLLIYPVTDLRFLTKSIQEECAEGFLLTKEIMEWFAGHYLNSESEINDYRASPLLAESLEGLPATVLVTAGFDPLRDEGLAFSDKLKESGVEVIYKEYPSYIHGFFNMPQVPGVAKDIREIASMFSSLI